MPKVSFSFIMIAIIYSLPFFAQGALTDDQECDILTIYPPMSISKQTLMNAKTVSDLDKYYKNTWVKEYVSVTISTIHNQKIKKEITFNDTLSDAQLKNIKTADLGSNTIVDVLYYPDNSMSYNDVKEHSFTFMVNPDQDSKYTGSSKELDKYLEEAISKNIKSDVITGFGLAIVTFLINENGQITDVHLSESTQDEETNELLISSVCNMPDWIPASFANGTKIAQKKALIVGNRKSCLMNLLNHDPYRLPE